MELDEYRAESAGAIPLDPDRLGQLDTGEGWGEGAHVDVDLAAIAARRSGRSRSRSPNPSQSSRRNRPRLARRKPTQAKKPAVRVKGRPAAEKPPSEARKAEAADAVRADGPGCRQAGRDAASAAGRRRLRSGWTTSRRPTGGSRPTATPRRWRNAGTTSAICATSSWCRWASARGCAPCSTAGWSAASEAEEARGRRANDDTLSWDDDASGMTFGPGEAVMTAIEYERGRIWYGKATPPLKPAKSDPTLDGDRRSWAERTETWVGVGQPMEEVSMKFGIVEPG